MISAPNVYDAEPIPDGACARRLMPCSQAGTCFATGPASGSPVSPNSKAKFAEFMGVPFALAVNSCSSALFLSLEGPRHQSQAHKVLLPAFTFAAVPSAVVHAGAEPVLVDVGAKYSGSMSTDFEAKLVGRHRRRPLMSHMRGHTSDMDAIMALCEGRGDPRDRGRGPFAWYPVVRAAKSVRSVRIGCFSFQSFQADERRRRRDVDHARTPPDRPRDHSPGAYEHNWKKHPAGARPFAVWQNKLPLFKHAHEQSFGGRPAARRSRKCPGGQESGRANHDYVAADH